MTFIVPENLLSPI